MTSTVVIPEAAVVWTSLEKLALVSAVVKKGDSNWKIISRLVRPYVSPTKNIELFSPKNCALKYDLLLEKVRFLHSIPYFSNSSKSGETSN